MPQISLLFPHLYFFSLSISITIKLQLFHICSNLLYTQSGKCWMSLISMSFWLEYVDNLIIYIVSVFDVCLFTFFSVSFLSIRAPVSVICNAIRTNQWIIQTETERKNETERREREQNKEIDTYKFWTISNATELNKIPNENRIVSHKSAVFGSTSVQSVFRFEQWNTLAAVRDAIEIGGQISSI